MKAPILSPDFQWIKSTDHLTPEGMNAFAARQRARIAAAEKARAAATKNVAQITKRKA